MQLSSIFECWHNRIRGRPALGGRGWPCVVLFCMRGSDLCSSHAFAKSAACAHDAALAWAFALPRAALESSMFSGQCAICSRSVRRIREKV